MLINSNIPVIISVIITAVATSKQIKKQFLLNKNWQDSKFLIPIIIRLSENLLHFYYFLLHKGALCRSIEPKCPSFTNFDDIATRGYQFFQIGTEILNDTKQIIYLLSPKDASNLINLCKKIHNHLENKENGKNRHLDFLQNSLLGYLEQKDNIKKEFDEEAEIFYNFRKQLNTIMETNIFIK